MTYNNHNNELIGYLDFNKYLNNNSISNNLYQLFINFI